MTPTTPAPGGIPGSIADFTGDERAARLLRDNLQALGERDLDPQLRHAIQEVLRGRLSMRELAGHDAFRALTDDGMRRAHEAWQELDPEQRAAVVRAGQESLPPAEPGPDLPGHESSSTGA